MQKIKFLFEKFKNFLFIVFLGNKEIKNTSLKKSFFRIFLIWFLVITICMGLGYLCEEGIFTLLKEIKEKNCSIGWGFQEGRPVTWLSFFYLCLVGFVSFEIFKVRKLQDSENKNIKMWYYLGFIFIYLGFDDLCRIHETIDHTLCKIFGWDPHGPADKIDDFLIVLYGIVALGVLIKYIKESFKFTNSMFYFLCAVFFAVISQASDLLGGKALESYISPENMHDFLKYLDILEEITKSLAEVFFVGAFLNMYHKFLGGKIK